MLVSQGNRCAICRSEESDTWLRRDVRRDGWHIDHDHVTGRVRGVLCPACNLMIGYAKDNSDVLTRAAAYLN